MKVFSNEKCFSIANSAKTFVSIPSLGTKIGFTKEILNQTKYI